MRVVSLVLVLGVAGAAAAGDPDLGGNDLTGGFRMEGDPKIETVFGDTAQFRKYVDRFYTVHADMQKAREAFSRNVHAVQATLAAHRPNGKGPRCPADAVSLTYARGLRFGQSYHRLGKELEASFVSIRDLDGLGETSGLTPDYRWKVAKVLKLYPRVLRDFREMKVSFQDQLAGEIKYYGCDPHLLIAEGDELEKGAPPPTGPVVAVGPAVAPKKGKEKAPAPPVPASTATFFVDNSSCPAALRVYLDRTMVGEVGSSSKAAFQSLVGRHELCLIPSTSRQQCGDPGTLRKTYVHDGWSIQLRCQ